MDLKYTDCVCSGHTACAFHDHGGRPVVELIEQLDELRKYIHEDVHNVLKEVVEKANGSK